jgi:hypothetical protein
MVEKTGSDGHFAKIGNNSWVSFSSYGVRELSRGIGNFTGLVTVIDMLRAVKKECCSRNVVLY